MAILGFIVQIVAAVMLLLLAARLVRLVRTGIERRPCQSFARYLAAQQSGIMAAIARVGFAIMLQGSAAMALPLSILQGAMVRAMLCFITCAGLTDNLPFMGTGPSLVLVQIGLGLLLVLLLAPLSGMPEAPERLAGHGQPDMSHDVLETSLGASDVQFEILREPRGHLAAVAYRILYRSDQVLDTRLATDPMTEPEQS